MASYIAKSSVAKADIVWLYGCDGGGGYMRRDNDKGGGVSGALKMWPRSK